MRRLSTRGLNVALAAALALVLLGGGAALFGPGWSRIERYENQLRERSERAEGWALQRTAFRNPSDAEREARRKRWAELLERVEIVDGPAALIALVSQKLQMPSVRAFEVAQSGTPELTGAVDAPPVNLIHAPEGDESAALVSFPVMVSFRASYADALALLDQIESRKISARLDSLDIKRQDPGVALQLGLTWYARNAKEDAG